MKIKVRAINNWLVKIGLVIVVEYPVGNVKDSGDVLTIGITTFKEYQTRPKIQKVNE